MSVQHIVQLKKGDDVRDESGNVLYRGSDFTLPPRPSYSYAYCADTQPAEKITEQIRNVDLLYHEATFLENEKEKARQTRHSTAAEAARVAKQANVKRLIIGHFSARYKELAPLLDEARLVFPETALANEGASFELRED